ncbi:MAG: hypothetical protein JWL59_1179 [Chthoniobacteraceae bacterium]|nr:hypothetical protein [Chthoniobacteraceae bacterium]
MKKIPALLTLIAATILSARAELRVPAFTAYSRPDPNALDIHSPAGIKGWKDGGQQALWFGEIKHQGELTAAITLRLPKDQKAAFKLSVGEQSREATAIGGDSEITVSFGAFEVSNEGYLRLALSLPDLKGLPDAQITALVLDGPASVDAHFNLEPRRNAASVHLTYPLPKESDLDAFYCEVTAVEDPVHTFYMACGFQRGYFGMQVISSTERRIIFSVWDSGAGKTAMKRDGVADSDRTRLLAKGENVIADAFGGEGTGGHSHLIYPWKTGEPQRFILTAKTAEKGSAIYTGYWFHPEKKTWMLIAQFSAPNASASLGHFHSFSENFVGNNGDLQRKALYGNQWIHSRGGQWSKVTEASFSHDATGQSARLDRFMGVEGGAFFLAHGGFTKGYTKFGEHFTRPLTGKPPVDFSNLDQ